MKSVDYPAAGAAAHLIFWLLAVFAAGVAWADEVEAPASTPASISVTNAYDLAARNADVVILDVRTPGEFSASHISGAVNLSVEDESFADRISELNPETTYVVHCTANPAEGRSMLALRTMNKLGLTHLYSLEGGYVAWSEAKLPLEESKR